jgi:hypothetical protein
VTGTASPTITGCDIAHSGGEAILWNQFSGRPFFSQNTGRSNGVNAIFVGNGTLTQPTTFHSNELPYLLEGWDGNLVVPPGNTLTVNAGTVIKNTYGRDGGAIIVQGELKTLGTVSAPVVLTSATDDSLSGDTNNDQDKTKPLPGDWSGIRAVSGGRLELTHTEIRYAGHVTIGWQAWHPAAAIFLDGGFLNAEAYLLEASENAGVRFQNAQVILRNSTIRRGKGAAVENYGSAIAGDLDLSGTVAQDNGVNGIALSGSIAGNPRYEHFPLPYVVQGWITIPATNTVTLAPGSRWMFIEQGSSVVAGMQILGELQASGTSAQPILFTSIHDSNVYPGVVLGDTNAPAPANWNGLIFQPGSTGVVEHCILRYAGHLNEYWNYLGGGAIVANDCSPTLRDNLITDVGAAYAGNSGHGVRLSNSGAQLANNRVERAVGFAFYIMGDGPTRFPVFGVNQADACGINGIRLPTAFKTNQVLPMPGLPYILDTSLSIPEGVFVNIQPGCVFKFRDSSSSFDCLIANSGRLLAEGTATQPIVFTSIHDDDFGGDTLNDGNAVPPLKEEGYARWASVASWGETRFNFCLFRYGGYANYNWTGMGGGMLELRGGSTLAQHCRFENPGAGYTDKARGVLARGGELQISDSNFIGGQVGAAAQSGAKLTINHSRFQGQTEYGVANNGSGPPINALFNDWGSPSGPKHPTNPGGTGMAVTDLVYLNPWLGGSTNAWTTWQAQYFTPEQRDNPLVCSTEADPDQ